jgi:hypothetical protein
MFLYVCLCIIVTLLWTVLCFHYLKKY